MKNDFNRTVTHGFIWSLLERFSSKLVIFILQLVLARILVPADYGLCALLLIFVNIGSIIITSGFPSALIQKRDATRLDYSSIFYICLFSSIVLYIILYICAPWISEFFNDSRMTKMLRILAISLPIGAYNSIQITFLKRELLFKPIFVANIIAAIISAIISIVMAFNGYGAWAIIFQYIINLITITTILFMYTHWVPALEFSKDSVKRLFAFGWKYMATSLTASIAHDLYTAAIGKVYNKSQLGTYDTGNKISQTITDTITSGMTSVLFPMFAKIQDSPEDVKAYLKKANQLSCFIVFPLIAGLIPLSEPLIKFVLTEKWIAAVPFMQISCLMFILYPLHYSNMQAISGRGFAGKSLKIEIYKKISQLLFLFITLPFSLILVAVGRVVSSYIELYIIMKPNIRLINYSPIDQLKDIFPSLLSAFICAGCMYVIHYIFTDGLLLVELVLQIFVGLLVYILFSYFYNRCILLRFISLIQRNIKRK